MAGRREHGRRPGRASTTWLARIRGLSRPLLISLRNTFRRRVRLVLTLITLTLGGAIFISTFNVRASMDAYIARLGKYFIADVNLTFDRPYRLDEIQRGGGSRCRGSGSGRLGGGAR